MGIGIYIFDINLTSDEPTSSKKRQSFSRTRILGNLLYISSAFLYISDSVSLSIGIGGEDRSVTFWRYCASHQRVAKRSLTCASVGNRATYFYFNALALKFIKSAFLLFPRLLLLFPPSSSLPLAFVGRPVVGRRDTCVCRSRREWSWVPRGENEGQGAEMMEEDWGKTERTTTPRSLIITFNEPTPQQQQQSFCLFRQLHKIDGDKVH